MSEQDDDIGSQGNERYTHGSGQSRLNQDELNTGVHASGDGRIDININGHKPSITGFLNDLQCTPLPSDLGHASEVDNAEPIPNEEGAYFPLHLNVVVQVIGSRGDIQPFVALGKELKAHGHRVRLATHLAFRDFVLDAGLEFFNVGGDPAELMDFMVKNSGLFPAFNTMWSGAIQRRRREMRRIINGCWRSCFETGDGAHQRQSFVADAIIANPPSMAHIHCAQRLGIPVHIMFTMPWSPTQSFPHPLANIHHEDCKPTVANFISYVVVDMMVWQGLGDIVNKFRKTCLSLDSLDNLTGPNLIHRLQTPCAYLWSPALLPKPRDWSDKIDICGFSFLPSEPDYTPPEQLDTFLKAGSKPIYVGFGSIVLNDQTQLTEIVFEVIKRTGQRALVSEGWGNLRVDDVHVPDNVLVIGSCPHDWLFRQVSCVVHHGGAGTTAAGLALGRPSVIIPFFGDQHFWGVAVARAGAGPVPIPHKQLTVEKLTSAIEMALKPSTQEKAQEIGDAMQKETGVKDGVRSFHRHLDLRSLRCAICPSRPAVWHLKHTEISLSAFAATILVEIGKLSPKDFVLHRHMEYDTYRNPAGPVSAGAHVLLSVISKFMIGLVDVPTQFGVDLVAAGRALSQPEKHTDPLAGCNWHRVFRGGNTASEEGQDKIDGEDELENTTRDEDEEYPNSSLSDSGTQRRRTAHLEEKQTMSTEVRVSRTRNVLSETAIHGSRISKGLLNVIIWLPTDLSLSLAKGFRNAPKLYHDPMVKADPKILDFRSGFRAAGDEFKDGFYYGITGLVTQPRFALNHTGTKGLFKGIGKGVGGLVLKPPAGLWGLAGYPLTGLRRSIWKSLGKSLECRVVSSRIAQGYEEIQASSAEERTEVLAKWLVIEGTLRETTRRHCQLHANNNAV